MTILLWSALASSVVVTVEYLFRRGWVWHEHLEVFIPAAILINFLIYRIVTGAPSLILAFVFFALANVIARALVGHFLLDEPVARGNLVAAVCLLVAATVGRLWR